MKLDTDNLQMHVLHMEEGPDSMDEVRLIEPILLRHISI